MLLSLGEAPIVNTITVIFIPIVNNSAMAMHAIVSKGQCLLSGRSRKHIYTSSSAFSFILRTTHLATSFYILHTIYCTVSRTLSLYI